MSHLRLILLAFAAILVVTLVAFALVGGPVAAPGDDDIIIKGGSLDVECGVNHKTDNAGCLGLDDGAKGKYKHKQKDKHITKVVVRETGGKTLFDSSNPSVALGRNPQIVITYKK